MAFWAIFKGFGPLFYLIWGLRYILYYYMLTGTRWAYQLLPETNMEADTPPLSSRDFRCCRVLLALPC